MGRAKAAAGFDAYDPERENAQQKRLTELAEQMGLNPAIVQEYLEFVTGEAKKRHRMIRAEQWTTWTTDVAVVLTRLADNGSHVDSVSAGMF